MKRAGAKVELTLQLSPLGKLPRVEHTPDALGVLTYGLVDSECEGEPLAMGSLTSAAETAPIVVAAREDMARLGIEWDGATLCVAIAKGYVLDWKLALPKLKLPDLDTADLATVRAFLEQPRPTGTLTMTVSDPAWLAHLDSVSNPTTFLRMPSRSVRQPSGRARRARREPVCVHYPLEVKPVP